MARLTEAEQLRECRAIFERATRDNITMAEAKKRIAHEKIELKRRAIAELRGEDWRRKGARAFASPLIQGGQESQFWWKRGDFA